MSSIFITREIMGIGRVRDLNQKIIMFIKHCSFEDFQNFLETRQFTNDEKYDILTECVSSFGIDNSSKAILLLNNNKFDSDKLSNLLSEPYVSCQMNKTLIGYGAVPNEESMDKAILEYKKKHLQLYIHYGAILPKSIEKENWESILKNAKTEFIEFLVEGGVELPKSLSDSTWKFILKNANTDIIDILIKGGIELPTLEIDDLKCEKHKRERQADVIRTIIKAKKSKTNN